jgi:hypothetical protein
MQTLKLWHQLITTSDPSILDDLLADDCVFYSPVVHAAQSGKAITKMYLSAAIGLFSNYDFHYIKEIISDNSAALEFEVEIEGIQVNGVDIISWNENGLITEFKVFVRPLKGVNLLHQKMAEMLKIR